jgi:hypothetical protein
LDQFNKVIRNEFASSWEIGGGLWVTGFYVEHLVLSQHTLFLLRTVRASVGTVFERF